MFDQDMCLFSCYYQTDQWNSGHFGKWYAGLGAQTLAPKKHFSSFLFSAGFQQKICWSSDQWNGLECKNAGRREKQWGKELNVKKETVNKTVFIHLTT